MSKLSKPRPSYGKRDKKVFIAMSGGVDSSVAALLLKKATPNNFSKLFGRPTPKGFRGYDVTGVYMKGWSLTGCAEEDARDARRVAGALGIPFYVFDFENEFKKAVVDYMISEYAIGRTPNPDVMCNREIKFGLFLKKAPELGADYIATGHYVRKSEIRNSKSETNSKSQNFKLLKAKDKNKDQSYFLWTLTQEQLKYCLFPIGDYIKPQIRALAKKYKLPTAEKPDSQGVCFVGEIDVAEFLKEKLGKNPGPILTLAGEKVGVHDGLSFYTIGQRKGIGSIGGGTPYYVVSKNAGKNALIVAEAENPALFSNALSVKSVNWISGKSSKLPLNCLVRIRYRQPLQQAQLVEFPIPNFQFPKKFKIKNSKFKILKVIFDEPQRAITPGQSVVFYLPSEARRAKEGGDLVMLGGGVIE